MDKEISVSVVIPTKNGGEFLDRCLAGVFSQKTSEAFEVIVIDSGSSDRTLEICRKYPVKLFQVDGSSFNHGLTRNLGIKMARGEFVILLSQDAIPCEEDWIESFIRDIRLDNKIAGVYGRQIPDENADVLTKRDLGRYSSGREDKFVRFIRNRAEYVNLNPEEKYMFCSFDNVSSCIRKDVWEKIPFAQTNFAEDLDWSKKVLEAGYKIAYIPDAAVTHSHRRPVSYEYKRAYLHHQKLYELFEFNPVPTLSKVLAYSLAVTLRDMAYVFKKERKLVKKLNFLFRIPLASFLKVFGQYKGARGLKKA